MTMAQIPTGHWMWTPDWQEADQKTARIVLFRRTIQCVTVPDSFVLHISADTRYKLMVNGCLVAFGPARGDGQIWFYDTVQLAPHLCPGENVVSIAVLRYPTEPMAGNFGMWRTGTPGLYLAGEGAAESLADAAGWKCYVDRGVEFVPENPFFAPLRIHEVVQSDPKLCGWQQKEFLDAGWHTAVPYAWNAISTSVSPGNLHPRPIPPLALKPQRLAGVVRAKDSKEAWCAFLDGAQAIQIPPHTETWVELDAGELTTSYVKLTYGGGRASRLELLQAECYAAPPQGTADTYENIPVKGDRTDALHGNLYGDVDVLLPQGEGNDAIPAVYEPFWFRTFRFLRLHVKTEEEPLTLGRIEFLETGYPLAVRTRVTTSDPSLADIWDISLRSLRRCMHETYEDCPFYEQLQYAMDARSQILYTYAISADDRLARQCMDDFRRAARCDGLLNCSYPNVTTNVIPGFSIYYILMLADHMQYFGDKALLRHHMPTVEGILQFFADHRTSQGLVDKIGGLNRPDNFWSFIDWTPEWDATNGVPPATMQGPITMESLLYLLGLQNAAKISGYIGLTDLEKDYRRRADALREAIRTHCIGKDGLLRDGPDAEQYSQHCQVFAVLTGVLDADSGRDILLKTLREPENYAQCSVAMMLYLFRALEMCNLYEETDTLWNTWRQMVQMHLTTCAEDMIRSRSDCHAWGALALYELPSVILGVRPVLPGYAAVEVRPVPGRLTWAEGTVFTPKGSVSVKWKKTATGVKLQVTCPTDLEVRIPPEYTDAIVQRR